ncbi:MAG TPA: hypothetical protein VN437_06055 [Rectinemataceae bacterium]|nr:hypothetical protein [Rectinemataceae bacterium]
MPVMKRVVLLCIAFVFSLSGVIAGGKVLEPNKPIQITGTVTYIDIEGGFWGIVSDDGIRYDPTNLDGEFHRDGLRVRAEIKPAEWIGVHMWGTIVDIESIVRVFGR